MKNLKTLGAAVVLALLLSITALADTIPGDSHSPGRSQSADDPTVGSTIAGLPQAGITDPAAVDSNLSVQTIAGILWSLALMY